MKISSSMAVLLIAMASQMSSNAEGADGRLQDPRGLHGHRLEPHQENLSVRINTLIPVPGAINVGVPTPVTFIANIEPTLNVVAGSIELIEVNAAGHALRVVGRMYDDGTNGDEIGKDNNYTLQLTVAESLPTSLRYWATASIRAGGATRRVTSPVADVAVAAEAFAKPIDPALLVTDDDGTYPVNQLIVRIVDGVPLSAVQALASSLNASIVGHSPPNIYQFELSSTDVLALHSTMTVLKMSSIVVDVLKNAISISEAAVDNDLTRLQIATPDNTVAYRRIHTIEGFQALVDLRTPFVPIRIGVLDSGVLATHPEFEGVNLVGDTSPLTRHGTRVAGIIGANNRQAFGSYEVGHMNGLLAGVPSSANASGSKVRYIVDSGLGQSVMEALAGLDRLATAGARVINLSFGYFSRGPLSTKCAHALGLHAPYTPGAIQDYTGQFRDKFRRYPNILFVTAAGNFGYDVMNGTPMNIEEPNVITIGATDLSDARAVWDTAKGGIPGCASASNFGGGVELAAPGSSVYVPTTSNPPPPLTPKGWERADGTSFAAPLVTGTAGLLLAINPGLSPENLIGILRQTADRITTDQPIGGLRLNFEAAVAFVAARRSDRVLADVDGDGQADYCRFVGTAPDISLSCSLASANEFRADQDTFKSIPGIDRGYAGLPRILADVNDDRRADYCRFVGDAPNIFLSCNLATATGFDPDQYMFNSIPRLDWGYPNLPRTLADVNGDGRADYCRFVGDAPNIFLSCDLASGTGFDPNQYMFNSMQGIDVGYGP